MRSEEVSDVTGSSATDLDIAVIGMACAFPGAGTPTEFWANLCDGVESVRLLSDEDAQKEQEQPRHLAQLPRLFIHLDAAGFVGVFRSLDAQRLVELALLLLLGPHLLELIGTYAGQLALLRGVDVERVSPGGERTGFDVRAMPGMRLEPAMA